LLEICLKIIDFFTEEGNENLIVGVQSHSFINIAQKILPLFENWASLLSVKQLIIFSEMILLSCKND